MSERIKISEDAIAALKLYYPFETDGVMALVSRQALDEAIAFLDDAAQGCTMFGCQQRED